MGGREIFCLYTQEANDPDAWVPGEEGVGIPQTQTSSLTLPAHLPRPYHSLQVPLQTSTCHICVASLRRGGGFLRALDAISRCLSPFGPSTGLGRWGCAPALGELFSLHS